MKEFFGEEMLKLELQIKTLENNLENENKEKEKLLQEKIQLENNLKSTKDDIIHLENVIFFLFSNIFKIKLNFIII